MYNLPPIALYIATSFGVSKTSKLNTFSRSKFQIIGNSCIMFLASQGLY